MWKCPKCGGVTLCVNVVVTAALEQSESGDLNEGNFETLLIGGSHEWDGDSLMQCKECSFSGPSCEFDTEFVDEPEEGKLRQRWIGDNVEVGEVFINQEDQQVYKAVPVPDICEPCEGCVFMSEGKPVKGCSTSPDCLNIIFVRQP